jgi:hypothetical protein
MPSYLFGVETAVIQHGWGQLKTMMYTDFHSPLMLTTSQVNFLVNNFAVVGLEKAFGNRAGYQTNSTGAQYVTAKQIRKANPSTKVLMYWGAQMQGMFYNNLSQFQTSNPSWVLKDKNGKTVLSKNNEVQLDFTITAAMNWFSKFPSSLYNDMLTVFSGLIIDTVGWQPYYYANLTDAKKYNLSIGNFQALKQMQTIWNTSVVVGNGISMYPISSINSNPFLPNYNTNITQYSDGIMSEHMASFESYSTTGSLVISRVVKNLDLIILSNLIKEKMSFWQRGLERWFVLIKFLGEHSSQLILLYGAV